jgi:lysophospholipase L1-like esterase
MPVSGIGSAAGVDSVAALVSALNTATSGIPGTLTVLEALPLTDYGHSIVAGVSEVSGSKWVDRVANRLRVRSHNNYGVAGYSSAQVAQKALQTWTPGTRGLVLVMGIFNDVQYYTTDILGPTTTTTSLRALLAFLTSGAAYGHLSDTFTYNGSGWSTVSQAWSYGGAHRRTNTPGDSVDLAWNGDSCYLLGQAFAGTGGGLVTATSPGDGATVATFRTDGMATAVTATSSTTPFVHEFSGFGTGDHTLRLTLTSGTGFVVNALLIPGPYPPGICLVREGPVQTFFAGYDGSNNGGSSAGNTALATRYNPAADALAAEFPTLVMTPSAGPTSWDAATCASSDGLHPGEKGSGLYADAAQRALADVSWRQGLNNLGLSATFTQPIPAYYVGSPATPGRVTGVTTSVALTSVTLNWTRPANNGALISTYLVEYKLTSDSAWTTFTHSASTATSIAVTGLTTGSSYDFRVSAVNSVGTGTASATATATPATPGAILSDDFNRANTTTGLGTAVTGGAWSSNSNVRILGNQMVVITGAESVVYLDAAVSDATLQATFTGSGSGADPGLIGRLVDANNYWMAFGFGNASSDTTHWAIAKKSAGSFSFPTLTSTLRQTGDVVKLVFSGSTITLYINGTQVGTVTDSSFSTATKYGFRSGFPGSSTTSWDDFTVT